MGVHKNTHENRIITNELMREVENMRRDGFTYERIAKIKGLNPSTLTNAISEYNIGERSPQYRAASFSGWNFSQDNVGGLRD